MGRWIHSCGVAGLLIFAASPRRALAQDPRFSEVINVGLELAQGRGGRYDPTGLQGFRWDVSIRRLEGRWGILGDFSAVSLRGSPDRASTCSIVGGDCQRPFPEMHGWQTIVGPLFRPAQSLEADFGIGIGRYFANDTVLLRPLEHVGVIDVAFFPFAHAGLAASLEAVSLERYSGSNLSLQSLSFAIRLRN